MDWIDRLAATQQEQADRQKFEAEDRVNRERILSARIPDAWADLVERVKNDCVKLASAFPNDPKHQCAFKVGHVSHSFLLVGNAMPVRELFVELDRRGRYLRLAKFSYYDWADKKPEGRELLEIRLETDNSLMFFGQNQSFRLAEEISEYLIGLVIGGPSISASFRISAYS